MTTNATLERPRRARQPLTTRLVLGRLARIASGQLTVHTGGESQTFGAPSSDGLQATIHVHDPRFFGAIAQRGSIGAGEAFAHGWWSSPDPTAVVRILVRNRSVLESVDSGLARLSRPALALYHALRRNTERGSRENIGAHYDLSNEFFALFLDESMTYSCGIFEREDSTLLEASIAKIDRICRKLDLKPEDHLLEIGTGWGALAIHAAREYGCRVTTTTISREQHALAAERIRAAGLEDRITLLFEDYRKLEGQYDKLVSVEMIEAVGHRYYDAFFERCGELLKPEGRMCLQAITIADQHYETARRSVDFIQRHIFPGSCIPSVQALSASMTRASDLKLFHMEDIGPHYARTLAEWHANLDRNREQVLALGMDEEFVRLWEFYFHYCAGGFAERHIGDVQMVLVRPEARPDPILADIPQ